MNDGHQGTEALNPPTSVLSTASVSVDEKSRRNNQARSGIRLRTSETASAPVTGYTSAYRMSPCIQESFLPGIAWRRRKVF